MYCRIIKGLGKITGLTGCIGKVLHIYERFPYYITLEFDNGTYHTIPPWNLVEIKNGVRKNVWLRYRKELELNGTI